MITDPWTYKRDVDLSRLRLAAAVVAWLVPEGYVELLEDGALDVVLTRPPVDFLGMWKASIARRVTDRCALFVPRICGWCPEVNIRWAR